MKTDKYIVAVVTLCALVVLNGCSSVKVKRTAVDKTVDLSGSWNDSDARMVAEEMIKDCLERRWLTDSIAKKGSQPIVIVGTVMNRTDEHINSNVFVSDLEQTLLNSGKVTFVASPEQRPELRDEKADQQQFATPETAKPQARETGADYMLQGSINSIKDQVRGKYVILYQVNLELIDVVSNVKVWIGQKEIKKVVARKAFGL
jgi:penicillin-binding protein activator